MIVYNALAGLRREARRILTAPAIGCRIANILKGGPLCTPASLSMTALRHGRSFRNARFAKAACSQPTPHSANLEVLFFE
jgi:hypothetical protein